MKHIYDVTREQIEVLFKLANDFEDFKITRVEKEKECDEEFLEVYAEAEWNDGEGSFTIEDCVVKLYPTFYLNCCDFSDGFSVPVHKYIQWALWCGLIEPINFDELKG